VRSAKINTPKILLLLPLLLLHLQFGVALLHYHHSDSWYDHKDSTHHICTANHTLTTRGGTSTIPASPTHAPFLSTARIHVAAPHRLILGNLRPEPSVITAYQPIASFPNRAPPA